MQRLGQRLPQHPACHFDGARGGLALNGLGLHYTAKPTLCQSHQPTRLADGREPQATTAGPKASALPNRGAFLPRPRSTWIARHEAHAPARLVATISDPLPAVQARAHLVPKERGHRGHARHPTKAPRPTAATAAGRVEECDRLAHPATLCRMDCNTTNVLAGLSATYSLKRHCMNPAICTHLPRSINVPEENIVPPRGAAQI